MDCDIDLTGCTDVGTLATKAIEYESTENRDEHSESSTHEVSELNLDQSAVFTTDSGIDPQNDVTVETLAHINNSEHNETENMDDHSQLSDGNDADEGGSNYEPSLSEGDSDIDTQLGENEVPRGEKTCVKRERSKRGKPKKETWVQLHNKIERSKGQEYFGRRKTETGKIVFDVKKSGRKIKPRCSCDDKTKKGFKCIQLTEENRNMIFEQFWKLNWGEKKVFVNSLVDRKPVTQSKVQNGTESRRKKSLSYYLKPDVKRDRVKVCKRMFLNTLCIGEWSVLNWVSPDNFQDPKLTDNSQNNKDSDTPVHEQVVAETKVKNEPQRQLIQKFLGSLPKLESHYCRKDTKKLYLERRWQSKTEIFRCYESFCKEQGKENLKSSTTTFFSAFEDMNLSLFQPKKDQCDTCCSFVVGNLDQEVYNSHLKNKEDARREKEIDKNESDDKTAVFTMDLQAVLLSPSLNASALYYRTKLKVHNFTIYNLKNHDGFCYLWDESEGGLNADEFASIICHFIKSEVDKTKYDNIILYSDGCTYQNRNSILSNALILASKETRLTITQKFLEKGHTQMECDSMHAMIEKKLRNREIYSPSGYIEACRSARMIPKPYKVEYLYHEFFLKYSDLQFVKSIRPGRKVGDPVVTDLRLIQYKPDGSLRVKLNYNQDYLELPGRLNKQVSGDIVPQKKLPGRSKKQMSEDVASKKQVSEDLVKLYTSNIPLEPSKFKHLQEMKFVLPRDVHLFYDTLPHRSPVDNNTCKQEKGRCPSLIHID